MPTVLIVLAHHTKTSFNHAMAEVAKTTLEGQGHKVIVSDLYAMGFNPVMSRKDSTDYPEGHSNYGETMCDAMTAGTVVEDIKAEQRKVTEADLIIFQFPIQLMMIPAIMKGWMERVMLENYAINFPNGDIMEKGYMKGKKAVLCFSTGGGSTYYTPRGILGDYNTMIWPMQQILCFFGFEILKPNPCYAVQYETDEYRKKYMSDWSKRLSSIFDESGIYFPKLTDFTVITSDKPWMGPELPENFKKDEDTTGEYGATLGHHMGKRMPQF